MWRCSTHDPAAEAGKNTINHTAVIGHDGPGGLRRLLPRSATLDEFQLFIDVYAK